MKRVRLLWQEVIQTRITLLLILLNIAAFYVPWWFDNRAFDNLSKKSFLINWGGNIPALTLSGEYWRLLSSMFQHVNFMHLACNMLALWAIGYVLERRLPRLAFIGIYFCSGLAGGLLSALVHRGDTIVSCGASGAILGIAGALIACMLFQPRETKKQFIGLILSIFLTFGAGQFLPVDNAAHAGGLIIGLILGSFAILFAIKAGTVSQWLVHALLVLLFCLPLAGMRYVYLQQAIPGGPAQVLSAKLITIFSDMGKGSSSSMVTGLHDLNACIDNQLQETTPDLPACAKGEADVKATGGRVKIMLTQKLNSCMAIVEKLGRYYPDAADQQKLLTIHNYCSLRLKVYNAVFNREFANTVSAVDLQKTEMEIDDLTSHIHQLTVEKEQPIWNFFRYRDDEDEIEQKELLPSGMLNDITPAVYKAIHDGQCPYYSCKKRH